MLASLSVAAAVTLANKAFWKAGFNVANFVPAKAAGPNAAAAYGKKGLTSFGTIFCTTFCTGLNIFF